MSAIDDLRKTMARLRAPDGCPWDQEQTHESLCESLIEETAELLETIDRGDIEHMREELGDVLLQVVFHAQMAEERGDFNFDDVASEINEKLIRRHPHVFEDLELQDSDAVLKNWDAIKASEKKRGPEAKGVFKPIPRTLPALLLAREVYKEIDKKNLSDEALPACDDLDSMAEDLDEEMAGELLFQMAAACRIAKVDPESALRRYTQRLVDRIENGQS